MPKFFLRLQKKNYLGEAKRKGRSGLTETLRKPCEAGFIENEWVIEDPTESEMEQVD
jgi:hypothetical protein